VRIDGVDVHGKAVSVTPGDLGDLLLLFVSSTCHGCLDLFDAAQDRTAFGLGASDRLALVLAESPSDALVTLVGESFHVVAPDAWDAYRVTGPPFFSFVLAGSPSVSTEGVAWGVESVVDAIGAARAGLPVVDVPRLLPPDASA
jgi:hypothetical protein